MKKLTVLLALAASTSAFSQSMLGDLNFFQDKGSVLWGTELDYAKVDSELKASGAKDEYSNKSMNWNNAVTYGISDKFNVGLGVSWALDNTTTHEKASSGTKDKDTSSDGLSDFTVLGNYRLMNGSLMVDLVGGITLGFTDAELAQGTNAGESEGNNNQGHHSVNLGVAAGQDKGAWEWRGLLGLDYHLSGDGAYVTSGSSDADFESDSHLDWVASLAGQYRTSDKWAFGADLTYRILGDRTYDWDTAGADDTDLESDSTFTIGLRAKHNLSKTMLLSLGYEMTPGYDVEEKQGGTTDTYEYDATHRVVLGGTFLF